MSSLGQSHKCLLALQTTARFHDGCHNAGNHLRPGRGQRGYLRLQTFKTFIKGLRVTRPQFTLDRQGIGKALVGAGCKNSGSYVADMEWSISLFFNAVQELLTACSFHVFTPVNNSAYAANKSARFVGSQKPPKRAHVRKSLRCHYQYTMLQLLRSLEIQPASASHQERSTVFSHKNDTAKLYCNRPSSLIMSK